MFLKPAKDLKLSVNPDFVIRIQTFYWLGIGINFQARVCIYQNNFKPRRKRLQNQIPPSTTCRSQLELIVFADFLYKVFCWII